MSKAANEITVRGAMQIADKYNDDTLANWASELAMVSNNEYVSVDITNDEMDDTFEDDAKALGYDVDADGFGGITEFESRKTGRAFIYEAMEHKDNKTKRIAAYIKAIRRRKKWLAAR